MKVGIDFQETKRIKNETKLLEKIALPVEINYIKKFARSQKEKIASLWAVKEATFKALNTKAGEISFKEIELCHKDSGAPYLKLVGKAKKRFESLGKEIEVSLSHQKSGVVAIVVVL